MGPLIQVTPFFGVSDMDAATAFYRDVLGFTLYVNEGGYAYLERERVAIRLLALEGEVAWKIGSCHAYIDVRSADGTFAEVEDRLAGLPAERWGKPKDQPYGQREWWVRDPDGNLLSFGEGIGANAAQWDYRDA